VAGATGSVGPAGATGATGPQASLVYASINDFPATGSSTALYLAEDTSRLYQWESPVYVEVGTSGGGIATTSASDLTSGTLADARLSGNVVLTGDSRLTDSRTPTSHVHGNITNAGAIGSTTGQVVVTTTSGVLTTAATISASSQVSGLATVATSGSAADLSGTLADARLSSEVALHSQINTTLGQAAGVIDAIPRTASAAGVTAVAGQALMAFFTPVTTITVSQIAMSTANGAVAAGLTLARMGIYTYTEGSTATLVARTASDTSLFAATNTTYTRSLDTTGGYPSTYTLNAGTRYGVAYICVGTTQPQLVGRAVLTAVGVLPPRLSGGSSTGLSDLPTSFTPNQNSQAPFARLS
jgi:hypothetical protein